jgi:hypothetical protein
VLINKRKAEVEMKELTVERLMILRGGREAVGDLGCFLWVTELAMVVGVGLIGGGLLGAFAMGMAVGAWKSGSNPC